MAEPTKHFIDPPKARPKAVGNPLSPKPIPSFADQFIFYTSMLNEFDNKIDGTSLEMAKAERTDPST